MNGKFVSKSDEAYEYIKQKILKNELRPGEAISENQFADELEISRTPVRSAFQRLLLEGFIEIFPSRGAVIQKMSLEEAKDLYDLRMAIETFVMRQSFPYLSSSDIQNLRGIVEMMKEAFTKDEGKRSYESMKHDMAFHSYFLKFYRNEKIDQIFNSYAEKFLSFGYIALLKPGRLHETCEEHEKVVDALEAGDIDGAVQALLDHLEEGKNSALTS